MPPKANKRSGGGGEALTAASLTTSTTSKKTKKTKTTKSSSSSTTATTTTSTSTVIGKIIYAIRQLKEPGSKGSSRSSILKYIKSEFNNYDNTTALKKAFKKGVLIDKILIQNGQSFRVVNDPIIEKDDTIAEEDKLIIEDIIKKEKQESPSSEDTASATATIGDTVTVAYKGTLDNGYMFDSATKFTFTLGAGDVIKGWDQGIIDMKLGSKRKLIVPSKLGYGKRGCKPDIPPNSTLNFIITLKNIN
jgi:FKBP-type peptidyl-prolyl cis-trans isomerase